MNFHQLSECFLLSYKLLRFELFFLLIIFFTTLFGAVAPLHGLSKRILLFLISFHFFVVPNFSVYFVSFHFRFRSHYSHVFSNIRTYISSSAIDLESEVDSFFPGYLRILVLTQREPQAQDDCTQERFGLYSRSKCFHFATAA